MYTTVNPFLLYKKWGLRVSKLYRYFSFWHRASMKLMCFFLFYVHKRTAKFQLSTRMSRLIRTFSVRLQNNWSHNILTITKGPYRTSWMNRLICEFASCKYPCDLPHCHLQFNTVGVRSSFITKTCLYNVDPLKPHLNIVKLGFTRV